MKPGMPTIGVRFDLEKIDAGWYGFACWKVFWSAIQPGDLCGAVLDEHHTELFSYSDCLREDRADFVWRGAGGYVEILRIDTEQTVTDAAAGEVGLVACGS